MTSYNLKTTSVPPLSKNKPQENLKKFPWQKTHVENLTGTSKAYKPEGSLSLNGKTKKMKLGHRGANHPVKNQISQKVEITSQNHGFEVVRESLNKNIIVTHTSLFDNSIEGIKLKNKPVFSVQYHPESNPGPQDSHYLFSDFINEVKKYAKKKRH